MQSRQNTLMIVKENTRQLKILNQKLIEQDKGSQYSQHNIDLQLELERFNKQFTKMLEQKLEHEKELHEQNAKKIDTILKDIESLEEKLNNILQQKREEKQKEEKKKKTQRKAKSTKKDKEKEFEFHDATNKLKAFVLDFEKKLSEISNVWLTSEADVALDKLSKEIEPYISALTAHQHELDIPDREIRHRIPNVST